MKHQTGVNFGRGFTILHGADNHPFCRDARTGPEGNDLDLAKSFPHAPDHSVHSIGTVDHGERSAIFQIVKSTINPVR